MTLSVHDRIVSLYLKSAGGPTPLPKQVFKEDYQGILEDLDRISKGGETMRDIQVGEWLVTGLEPRTKDGQERWTFQWAQPMFNSKHQKHWAYVTCLVIGPNEDGLYRIDWGLHTTTGITRPRTHVVDDVDLRKEGIQPPSSFLASLRDWLPYWKEQAVAWLTK